MTLVFQVTFHSPFFLHGKERLPSGTTFNFSVETDGRLKQDVKDIVVDLLGRHCYVMSYDIKDYDSLPEV